MQLFDVDATPWRDAEGADLTISCRRCPWSAHTEHQVGAADPLTLAELVQRADEHTEVCR